MSDNFKVCVLNPDNTIQQTIVFSDKLIHLDDTIQAIKNKILIKLGLDLVSYGELYLFADFLTEPMSDAKLLDIYNDLSDEYDEDNETDLISNNRLKHLYSNYTTDTVEFNDGPYTFDAVRELFTKVQTTKRALGREFANSVNHLFSVNPFQYTTTYINSDASMYSSDASVLLNVGTLKENIIYACLAKDVLGRSDISQRYVCDTYFPFLYAKGIYALPDLLGRSQELIKETKLNITSDIIRLYDTVDMFHKIKANNDFLPYTNEGIHKFDIGLKTEFVNLLPLDSIFKNIHATANVPFIKYNPGFRRENMYRLYSKEIYSNGRRKPFLDAVTIRKLSKETGKSGEISLYTSFRFKNMDLKLYVDFQKNGSLRVHSSLSTPIAKDELNELLIYGLNPVITDINKYIQPIGYNIRKFNSLNDSTVEIYNISYISSIPLKKPSEFNMNAYRSCFTSLFVVESFDVNSSNGAKFRFKRVDNFQDMNQVDEFINVEKNNRAEVDDIIRSLAKEFGFTEEIARNHVIEFFTKHTISINENTGFPINMRISQADKMLHISFDNMTSYKYIDIIKTYIDSIIRIYHSPKTSGIPIKDIQDACKREINFNVVEQKLVEVVERPPPTPPIDLDPEFFMKTIAATAEETKKEYNEDDDELFGIEFDMEGGAKEDNEDDDDINPFGMKLKNPTIFQKRIEDRDPELIKLTGDGKTNQFSRTCRGEVNRHPVMLNETEKKRIDEADKAKGKFTNWSELLKYASVEGPDDLKPYIEALWRDKKTPMDKKQFEIFAKKLIETDTTLELNKKTEKEYVKRLKDKKLPADADDLLIELNTKKPSDKIEEFVESEMRMKRESIVMRIWDYLEPFKGSYLSAISYSTDPDKKFWYICPRYWSLKTNRSLTEDEVKELVETEGKEIMIPYKAETVPKGAYIYEFAHPQEHFVDGKYIPHYPGFIKNSKSKFDFPCCFKRDQVIEEIEEEEKKVVSADVDTYITEEYKFPVQKKRWGFLPKQVQDFFGIDNNDCVESSTIKRNHQCLLRYGVEQTVDQSILGCFADIYASLNNMSNSEVPTIAEMRKILVDAITVEDFISYNNNALSIIFRPSTYEISDPSKYEKSSFYNSINAANERELQLRNEIIGAYENFQRYLSDPDAHIDHTYIWDILTKPNSKLFPLLKTMTDDTGRNHGINLVILQISRDTDHIELVCPTNMYTDSYDIINMRTFILLKQDDFYEPVYVYHDINGIINPRKWFNPRGSYGSVDMNVILTRIQKITNDQCKPKNSLKLKDEKGNAIYDYTKALNAGKTLAILRDIGSFIIREQVVNYHFKTTGFIIEINSESVFVPCFPSTFIPLLRLTFQDDKDNWMDYETTLRLLTVVFSRTQQQIDCIPSRKVIDRNQVVGLVTRTNQYIKLDAPIARDASVLIDAKLGLKLLDIRSSDYLNADIKVVTNLPQDADRVTMIQKIHKESYYYTKFRSAVRMLLGLYDKRMIKRDLLMILQNDGLKYNDKLVQVEDKIHALMDDEVEFKETPSDFDCQLEKCKLELPISSYLIPNGKNNEIYFGKIADELIRFKRVRSFMLEPKNYLNISNVSYKINPDEILLLDSAINSVYLNETNVFSVNEYLNNITYEIAEPDKSKYIQPYSNLELPA
jgi:hypothetical protein